ncbi:MAG: hypothetical protein Ct9H300mP1_32530 [Planctomycetaceae bacterium]|nr:MAG: hypothetical protein Ct9H300mP1_32530 [Planctomycetaceae bacterium]
MEGTGSGQAALVRRADPICQDPSQARRWPAIHEAQPLSGNCLVCPNGDLLAVWYTTIEEWGREHAIAASRLRQGRDAWDEADLFWDAPDRNDHTPTIWSDPRARSFTSTGWQSRAAGRPGDALPKRRQGATWTNPDHRPEARFREHANLQHVSPGRRTICVPCDAVPGANGGSILHISKDRKELAVAFPGKPAPRF